MTPQKPVKSRKKRISYQEALGNKIIKLEEEISEMEDHFEYYHSTMGNFSSPANRVVGIDTRRYEEEYPLKVQELIDTKLKYNSKFEEKYEVYGD